jgi:hypothetical protein
MSNKKTVLAEPTNGAKTAIEASLPYRVQTTLIGTAALLFHRWNTESIEEKKGAKKGSAAKKSDDLESYVYRDELGNLALPGEYFRMSLVNAAKFLQDPRSPRKSAMDLFKAAVFPIDTLCSFGTADWDFIDQRRVRIMGSGITRSRPGMVAGWKLDVGFQVILPEYVNPTMLNETLQLAGRAIGVADFRPTFGRFQVVKFEVSEA